MEDKVGIIMVIVTSIITGILTGPYIIPWIFPNSPPIFDEPSLSSDFESPRPAGSTIVWVANAMDEDHDRLYYNFILKNATTESIIKKRGWGTDNKWIWKTSELDYGQFIVEACVRDGYHAKYGDEWDAQCSDTYTLINGRSIYIKNLCNSKISLILRYKSPSEGWTMNEWTIDSQERTYLSDNNINRVRSTESYISLVIG